MGLWNQSADITMGQDLPWGLSRALPHPFTGTKFGLQNTRVGTFTPPDASQ
jgi:hypothetical protein